MVEISVIAVHLYVTNWKIKLFKKPENKIIIYKFYSDVLVTVLFTIHKINSSSLLITYNFFNISLILTDINTKRTQKLSVIVKILSNGIANLSVVRFRY